MDESEQRMFDPLQKEYDAIKMDEKALIDSMCALQAENQALWMLLDAIDEGQGAFYGDDRKMYLFI